MRGIDWVRDGYGAIVARFGSFLDHRPGDGRRRDGGVVGLGKITPPVLPEEDQGAFFVVVQLPDGASMRAPAMLSGRSRTF